MSKEPWVYVVYVGKPSVAPLLDKAEEGFEGYGIVPIESKFPNLYTSMGNTWGGKSFNKPYYPCTTLEEGINQVEKPEGEHLIHHNHGNEYRVRFVPVNQYLVYLTIDYDEDIGSQLYADGLYVVFYDDLLPRMVIVETVLPYKEVYHHDYVLECSIPRASGAFLGNHHIQPVDQPL